MNVSIWTSHNKNKVQKEKIPREIHNPSSDTVTRVITMKNFGHFCYTVVRGCNINKETDIHNCPVVTNNINRLNIYHHQIIQSPILR